MNFSPAHRPRLNTSERVCVYLRMIGDTEQWHWPVDWIMYTGCPNDMCTTCKFKMNAHKWLFLWVPLPMHIFQWEINCILYIVYPKALCGEWRNGRVSIPKLNCLVVCSFVRSFPHSFVHLLVCVFVCLFVLNKAWMLTLGRLKACL